MSVTIKDLREEKLKKEIRIISLKWELENTKRLTKKLEESIQLSKNHILEIENDIKSLKII